MIAPSDPPLYATAMPRDCFWGGSVWTAVRAPPGNVAPSPNPSAARAAAKLSNPTASACDADAAVHSATASIMPQRTPTRSSQRPHSGFAMV